MFNSAQATGSRFRIGSISSFGIMPFLNRFSDGQNDPRTQPFWLPDGDRIVVPEARP